MSVKICNVCLGTGMDPLIYLEVFHKASGTCQECKGKGIIIPMSTRNLIFTEINKERDYQDKKWGTEFDDNNTPNDWIAYIMQYAGQGVTMPWNEEQFRKSMLKVATLAVAALETLDRNQRIAPRHYDNNDNSVNVLDGGRGRDFVVD